ncbi:MAG TPA: alpha/beta fold hydrolase [Blastocatellia bacterium]|nr:alpha/beta fold hydrolase [Blastocatellia bacterium]
MLRIGSLLFILSALSFIQEQTIPAQSQAATAQRPKLSLEPCRLPGWNEDVRCGQYEVYENRQANAGRKISLRVVVLPALSERAAPDPIFYFAGGPGGSAIDTVSKAGKGYLAGLRRERDLVFVDQRGTGGSNQLACNMYGDRNDMAAFFGELFASERLRACRAELEKVADLKLYSTPIAMADLDEARAALGYDKINLYGGSYGSTAAMAYLRQYPQRVRTVTLIGVAPPDMKLPLPFGKGVQNALERVFADCAAEEKCRAAFPAPMADLEAAGKRLEKSPASFETVNPFTRQPQKVTLTREAFGEAIRVMLYIPEFSRWLPLLAHQAAQGEFALFASVAFQSMRSLDDQIARGMHFSVVCGEDMPFITAADAERELAGTYYGDYRLKAYRRVCGIWPSSDTPSSFATPVKSDAPVLLITGAADPVTPPWLAEAAARHLPNSRNIVVPGTGHFYSFPCVNELVESFVEKGAAKELDVACLARIRRPAFFTEEMLKALANAQMDAQNRTGQAANEQVWQGVLDVGSAKLRLALRLAQSADGKLTGSLDSPDQKVMGIPIDTISRQEQTLRFEMNLISASYEGKLNAAGTEITGAWSQQGRSWPLNFIRSASGAK